MLKSDPNVYLRADVDKLYAELAQRPTFESVTSFLRPYEELNNVTIHENIITSLSVEGNRGKINLRMKNKEGNPIPPQVCIFIAFSDCQNCLCLYFETWLFTFHCGEIEWRVSVCEVISMCERVQTGYDIFFC